jgi:hypothetical protein
MNIYITLDYELFLGTNSGTVENCLIRPMKDFLAILDRYQVKCAIFVDSAFLLRLQELSHNNIVLKDEYEKIVTHILSLHTTGHDIQLHFHPQWLYSTWENGKWCMDTEHFKLSDMDEDFAFKTFANARLLLESIIGKRIIAFRAGGFSLTSFGKYIELFNKNGIKIDSSVCRGASFQSKHQCYDYRNIPAKTIYRFSTDITSECVLGEFIEMPVTTVRYSKLLHAVLQRIYKKKYHCTKYGDGFGIGNIDNNKSHRGIIEGFFQLVGYHRLVASIDGVSSVFLQNIHSKLQYKGCENMIIIGHPKFFSNVTLQKTKEFIMKNIHKASFLTVSHLIELFKNFSF